MIERDRVVGLVDDEIGGPVFVVRHRDGLPIVAELEVVESVFVHICIVGRLLVANLIFVVAQLVSGRRRVFYVLTLLRAQAACRRECRKQDCKRHQCRSGMLP